MLKGGWRTEVRGERMWVKWNGDGKQDKERKKGNRGRSGRRGRGRVNVQGREVRGKRGMVMGRR